MSPRTGRGSWPAGRRHRRRSASGRTIWNWSPPTRLQELRREPGQQRRGQPDEQEDGRDDGQAERPPLLEELLAQERREAGHRSLDLARPDEAAAVEVVRGRRADELEEHVLERRSRPVRRRQDDTRRRRPAPGAPPAAASGSVTATRTVPPAARRRSPTARPQRSTRRRRRAPGRARASGGRAGGRAPRGVVERALVTQPPAVQDRDPVADPLHVGEDVGREDDRRARHGAPRSARAGRAGPPGRASSPARRGTRSRLRGGAPGRSRAAGASRPSSAPIRRSRGRRSARPLEHRRRPARAARRRDSPCKPPDELEQLAPASSSRRTAGPGRGSRCGAGAPAGRGRPSTPPTVARPPSPGRAR